MIRRRGSILVQVLVMSLIMMMLATLLLRAVVSQWTLSIQSQTSTSSHASTDSILSIVNSLWNSANQPHLYCTGNVGGTNTGIGTCRQVGSGTYPCDCAAAFCGCNCDVIINGVTYTKNSADLYPIQLSNPVVSGKPTCALDVYSQY